MADYAFSYIGQYDGGSGNLILSIGFGGTLVDGAGGNTFDTSDTSMNDALFLGQPGDAYIGSWSDGTSTFYVCIDASSGDHYVYGPGAPIGGFPPTLAAMQASGTWSTAPETVQCFLRGTRIATPTGERAVEDLQPGDLVENRDGAPCRVKFNFVQTIAPLFQPPERLMPVRIAAGALGDGLPHTDLTVTADHGMLVDGVICHAGALVNGTSITRVPLAEMGERFTVYHVETEEHEIILANGAPAETFIDNVGRQAFDNFAEYSALYGEVPEMAELPYPRAMSARQVPVPVLRKFEKLLKCHREYAG